MMPSMLKISAEDTIWEDISRYNMKIAETCHFFRRNQLIELEEKSSMNVFVQSNAC